MTTQAQAFQAPQAPQNHAAFTQAPLKGKALRASYRYHNPLVLSKADQADLEIARMCVALDAMLQPNGLAPCEVHHFRSALAVSALIDESDAIEARIQAKSDAIEAWLEGQASWGEVIQAHQPKQTYTQALVRRAYAVLTFVGGYARVR